VAFPVEEHTALVASAVGYFKDALGDGGEGGTVTYVQNLNDSGTDSLRSFCEDTTARIILFEDGLNGTIVLASGIVLKSNKTVWGRHRDGTAADIFIDNTPANENGCFEMDSGASNVILSNLKGRALGTNDQVDDFFFVPAGTSKVWMDHISTTGDGTNGMDGILDIRGTDVTMSWCKGIDWSNSHLLVAADKVTFHNNLWRSCTARLPKSDSGTTISRVHSFNNWFDAWDSSCIRIIKVGAGASEGVLQRNVFDAGPDTRAIQADGGGEWEDKGLANALLNGSTADAQGTVFTVPYSFISIPVDNAGEQQTLRDLITADAGWQSAFPGDPILPLELQDRHMLPERSPGPKRGSHVWIESRQADLFLPLAGPPSVGPPVGRAVAGLS